jgi:hypothetical protein
MRKAENRRSCVIENLESRRLLSASVATIDADSATLSAGLHTLALAAKQFNTDLEADTAAGTAGLKGYFNHVAAFHAVIAATRATLKADLATIDALGSEHPKKLAATDLATAYAAVQTAKAAVDTAFAKHPAILSGNTTLQADKAAAASDFTALAPEYSALQADL